MYGRFSYPVPDVVVTPWLSTAGTRPRLSTGDGQAPGDRLRTLPGLCRHPHPQACGLLLPESGLSPRSAVDNVQKPYECSEEYSFSP